MPTLVKVRKWGNSLGLRLPRSFASRRDIVDGATLEIDDLKLIDARPRRRSSYSLKKMLKNYDRLPKELDFERAGKEMA